MARILVAQRDPRLAIALRRALQRKGHRVAVVTTASDALEAIAAQQPDGVVADTNLGDMTGNRFVQHLRTWSRLPVLLLLAESDAASRVASLDAGADDVLDKPFVVEELRARLDAALRRTEPTGSNPIIKFGTSSVDLRARTLVVDDQQRRLTPTQWRLLEVLITHEGCLLPYPELIRMVWGDRHGPEARATLRVHVRQLRAKLDDDPRDPRYIATEPRIGYRWIAPLEEASV